MWSFECSTSRFFFSNFYPGWCVALISAFGLADIHSLRIAFAFFLNQFPLVEFHIFGSILRKKFDGGVAYARWAL
jgi:hypothetical protein